MSKSINRSLILLSLVLCLISIPSKMFAQTNNLHGNWKIDGIFGLKDGKEYLLVKQNGENRVSETVTFYPNGTFSSGNSPQCGNAVFVNTFGNFILIDDLHVRFVLKEKKISSMSKINTKSESNLNQDLGIFYIYKDSNSIRLIPSNGILQEDKDKMLYAELMDFYSKNWKLYDYVWNETNRNEPEEIIKDCKDIKEQINLSDYKIVSSKNESYGDVFLIRESDDFRYLVYDSYNKKVSLAYPKK